MIKTLYKTLIIISSAALLTTCNKSDFPSPPYPRVETRKAATENGLGVTLFGKVSDAGENNITAHGFLWGPESEFTTARANKIELGEFPGNGEFKTRMESGLANGERYIVIAYVVTDKHTVNGNREVFTSTGSLSPEVSEISPTQGTWGDTLVIKGINFTTDRTSISVLFGTYSASVIGATSTELRCIVPNNIPDKTLSVTLSVAGYETTVPVSFVFVTPILETLTSSSGTFDDVITLTGKYFSKTIAKNTVLFNDKPGEVLEASPTQLKVKIPATIKTKTNAVKVRVNLQTSSENFEYTITPPTITSLSDTQGLIGSTLTIQGNNFNPTDKQANVVDFGGNVATVVAASKTSLIVTVPDGIYNKRSFSVQATIAEQTATGAQTFTIGDRWLKRSVMKPVEVRESGITFSINNKGYIGMGARPGVPYTSMWEFDPENSQWTAKATFPDRASLNPIFFSMGDYGYYGGGMDIYTNEPIRKFWRFDPANNTWIRLADLPMDMTEPGVSLSTSSKGYVLLNRPTFNFWQYDPQLDTWTRKTTAITPDSYYRSGFVMNDGLYFYATNAGSSDDIIVSFNFNTELWTNRYEMPNGFNPVTYAFTLNTKGYLYTAGHFFTITQGRGLERSSWSAPFGWFSFTVAGKAYVWGQSILWEFDPAFE